ncbi:MAG: hypothetical protein CFE43_07055, partial [Burkholderiales bacterium PBB3]
MPAAIFGAQAAVTILNRAFNDISPAALVYTNQVNEASADINAFAITFGKSFASLSDAALASRVLGNLGLLPNADLLLGVTDYFAANSAARGLVVLQLGQILTNLESATGSLAIYAPAAVAWNSEVTTSYTYSATATNTVPSPMGDQTQILAAAAQAKAAASLTAATTASTAATTAATALTTAISAEAAAKTKADLTDAAALTTASTTAATAKTTADAALTAAVAAKTAADADVVVKQAALVAAVAGGVQATIDAAAVAANTATAVAAARTTDVTNKTTAAATAATAATNTTAQESLDTDSVLVFLHHLGITQYQVHKR